MILDIFFELRGLTFGISYHSCIITITGRLQMKWSPCQQVNNAK
jgi:hypothetical protein